MELTLEMQNMTDTTCWLRSTFCYVCQWNLQHIYCLLSVNYLWTYQQQIIIVQETLTLMCMYI